MHKVKWDENEDNTGLTVYVDEGDGWILYNKSLLKIEQNIGPKENPAFSTFQAALKAGYEIVKKI